MPINPAPVEVIEPPVPDRVRRPADALRLALVVTLLVVVIAVADVAVGTTGALERDLALATSGLPRVLLQLFGWLGGIGVVVLPLVVGADLVVRGRYWQLVQALLAAGAGALLVLALRTLILDGHLGSVLGALTRPLSAGYTEPLDAVLVSIVALLTVADAMRRRRISTVAAVVVASLAVTVFLSGASTGLSIFCSVLLGWAVGLAFRYAFGAVSNRPAGSQVAQVLVASGIPLTRLELLSLDGGTRTYAGDTPSGQLDVRVLDRDTMWWASGRRLLRSARLRSASTRPPALTLRADIEHRTLMGLVLARAGIPAPAPVAVAEVGPFSALIAYAKPEGTLLGELGADLDDAQLHAVWQMLGRLQLHRIAHRGLAPDIVTMGPDGRAGLRRTGAGDIAASDVALRIDTAQLLTTVALGVGAERAVRTAVAELGKETVARALPLLQPLALTSSTRKALGRDKALLGALRECILRLQPSPEQVAPVELRRMSPRALITVVGGGVAAYLLLTQLAQVNLANVVGSAKWWWALATVAFAALTFAGASIALSGSVNVRLSFVRTYMTQLAVAFSGLVAPPAIGNLALNTRYLQKTGIPPAVAAASVGLAQLAQFCSYVLLLLTAGVLAGTGASASFSPPPTLVAAVLIVVLALLALLAVPNVRRLVAARLLPQLRTVLPQVLSVLQHPRKLGRLLGGALLLDASFVAALVCATRAFGADAPVASVAVVYFAGAIIGSAVPTPGGLGGIEAAMSAGLIAIGLDSGIAVSSVLLYRLATFWLPIPFGWFSLNQLQKRQAI